MSYWTVKRKVDKLVKSIEANVESESRNIENCPSNDTLLHDAQITEPNVIEEHSNDSQNTTNVNSRDVSLASDLEENTDNEIQNLELNYLGYNSDNDYLWLINESGSDSGNEIEENHSINQQLATWAVEFGITLDALSSLLRIIQPEIENLPKNPTELLGTIKSYEIVKKCGGEYYYFGIERNLKHILSSFSANDIICHGDTLSVQINIDGLPLFKSSKHQFWPILGRLHGCQNAKKPFVIAIFSGTSKPTNLQEFLQDFIDEVNELKRRGIKYEDNHFRFNVSCVICDAPAKAFVKNIKQYSGYYGCDKCTQEGVWKGKVTFPETNAPPRTDDNFRSMIDDDHHKGPSPLLGMDFKMVTQFPIDYMHCTCLGVMKRMIWMWIKGPLQNRFGHRIISRMSADLVDLRQFIPSEFARKPRPLEDFERWKATEFRQFLLYTGLIVIKKNLHKNLYQNFLLFSVSMHILLNEHLSKRYCDYVHDLMIAFVQHFGQIYGEEWLVYNVHGLIHLANDAREFGSLDNISAFPFENFLKDLKKMVRKPSFMLSQVVRRLSEKQNIPLKCSKISKHEFKKPHTLGPVPGHIAECKQYHSLKIDGRIFDATNGRDGCIRINDNIAKIENIIVQNDDVSIVYRRYRNIRQLFDVPMDSQLLGICVVDVVENNLLTENALKIQAKCALLPTNNGSVVIPLTDTVW